MEKMAIAHRNPALSLKELLYQKPYQFEFAQAIRLLHIINPIATSLGKGDNPEKEAVRLKSRVFLSAPPSDLFRIIPADIFNFNLESDFSSWTKSLADSSAQVYVNFLGIAGIQGPLPLPYTEALLDRLRHKDPVFQDFLDIFNHRLLSLFYRVQQKFFPVLNLTLPHESIQGKSLQALVGWPESAAPFSARTPLFYASLFWQKPHNPSALRAILQHLFQVPVQILPCQGAWLPIEEAERTYLGKNKGSSYLGQGTVLGKHAWCQNHGIIIRFAFKDFDMFRRFLPFGEYFFMVQHFIAFYIGPAHAFKIALGLQAKPVSWLRRGEPIFLGWTSWLGRKKNQNLSKVLPHDRQVILST